MRLQRALRCASPARVDVCAHNYPNVLHMLHTRMCSVRGTRTVPVSSCSNSRRAAVSSGDSEALFGPEALAVAAAEPVGDDASEEAAKSL